MLCRQLLYALRWLLLTSKLAPNIIRDVACSQPKLSCKSINAEAHHWLSWMEQSVPVCSCCQNVFTAHVLLFDLPSIKCASRQVADVLPVCSSNAHDPLLITSPAT